MSRRSKDCINLIKADRLSNRSRISINYPTFWFKWTTSPEWWASPTSRGKARGAAKGSCQTLSSKWNKTWKTSNRIMTSWTGWSNSSNWVKTTRLFKAKCYQTMKIKGYKPFFERPNNVSMKLSRKIGSLNPNLRPKKATKVLFRAITRITRRNLGILRNLWRKKTKSYGNSNRICRDTSTRTCSFARKTTWSKVAA